MLPRSNAYTVIVVRGYRSAWAAKYEACHQKLSLDMWAFMKAQGSAQDADAQHVYQECLRQPEIGLVEINTAEVCVR